MRWCCGTAGLPHILARFSTVPTARAARRSVIWAIGLLGLFCLMTIVLGLGAAAVVGSAAVRADNPTGNTAVPLLSAALGGGAGSTGGAALVALTSAVAFAAVLAVVAGLLLVSATSFAHDLYAGAWRRTEKRRVAASRSPVGRTPARCQGQSAAVRREVAVARLAALAIGGLAVVAGLFAQRLNVAFLVGLALAVAASTNLPTLLYSLFWQRFTTRGAVWAIYGGLVAALVLVAFSPVVSGGPDALVGDADFHWFPLENPGLVSIPLGFLAGWLGTVTSRTPPDPDAYAELEVRSLTGAGSVWEPACCRGRRRRCARPWIKPEGLPARSGRCGLGDVRDVHPRRVAGRLPAALRPRGPEAPGRHRPARRGRRCGAPARSTGAWSRYQRCRCPRPCPRRQSRRQGQR